jgi:RimJ/RimL family protein N-acetyltransferase
MSIPLELVTDSYGLVLRELASEADDFAFFAAIDANREQLSQCDDETASKYPNLSAVTETRLHPSNPDKIRMGIWNTDTFVGSINLTPDNYGSAEIDYWLDSRYTGNGYATLATRALAQYGIRQYQRVYAYVAEDNKASSKVLERAGFQKVAQELGRITFAFSGVAPDSKDIKTVITRPEQDLERFAGLPSRREALRAKDKDNLTVFLSLAVAKKLYRCLCCSGDINIGSEHVILSRVQISKRHNHHHIDFACTHEKILPTLKDIKVINPNETTASAMNARNRKYRYKKHRS